MDSHRQLAPCLVGRGTVSNFRDMLRALETLENITYRFIVDGDLVEEGDAQLVKLMADPESATLIVNGCLFLNVASFRFLDFERDPSDMWRFILHGDGTRVELIALESSEPDGDTVRPHLLLEEDVPDFETMLLFDDDEDDE
ncbi:MAG: hypothetical protein CVT67_11680 [Actinobacteria bacterium HGW-Actinobacteria-7]|jgi:hypothetical protein|nr:MAG: hypothetical protein CVT67_11680 [Actinobacteria bacterium HGW-Actinobacteria-7]